MRIRTRAIEKLKSLPRCVKYVVAAVFVLLVGAGNWLGISTFRIYKANLGELKTDLSQWYDGGKNERILVIAPHCDDETLSCGGVISRAVRDGAKVKVVMVTNGDGYYEVVRRLGLAGAKSYIGFGLKRQKESRAALRLLGVRDDDAIFLGYPDRGTVAMWLSNWSPDKPFRSRYTRCSRSPYADCFRPGTPYCGTALLSDLMDIIGSYRPTTIYYPHPSDQHSDHWAVHCFVTQALYELGMLDKVRTGLYLVHRGDWPIPQGLHPTLPMRPPAALTDIGTRWYESRLSRAEIAQKLKAVQMYRSQLAILGDFLRSFDRKSELFGSYRSGTIVRANGRFDAGDEAWARVPPCITDPVGDSLRVDVGRGGDIRFLRCCYDDKRLYARIELAHPHSRRMSYGIQVCGLPDAAAGRLTASISGRGRVTNGARAVRSGDTIDFAVPLYKLGRWNALLVCADSSVEKKKVDRTAWRLLIREDAVKPDPSHREAARLPARRTPASPARISP